MRIEPGLAARVLLSAGLLILVCARTTASAPPPRLKMLYTTGEVQIRQGSVWKKIVQGDPVLLPAVIRTGDQAEAIVLLDWKLKAAVRIPSASLLHLDTPADLTLEKGQVWILVDEPLVNHPRIRFRSGVLSAEAVVGSFILKGPERPSLEVYTDSAQARMGKKPPLRIDEGYRMSQSGSAGRLEYRDYTAWREYANRFSALKDDWAVRQLEADYAS